MAEFYDVEEDRIGVVSDKGLFYLKARKGWMLVFEHDAITIPKPGIRIGDTLAFISPAGVAYTARIISLGTMSKDGGGPRAMEFCLDGEGEHLHEVEAGWPVYLSAWSRH